MLKVSTRTILNFITDGSLRAHRLRERGCHRVLFDSVVTLKFKREKKNASLLCR